jgi:hypothetical protein
MHPSCYWPVNCKTQSSAPEDGQIIARNMLRWLKLLIKLSVLHLVGYDIIHIKDAMSSKYQIYIQQLYCYLTSKSQENLKPNIVLKIIYGPTYFKIRRNIFNFMEPNMFTEISINNCKTNNLLQRT